MKSLSKEAHVVASDYPVAWFIREVRVPEENAMFCEYGGPFCVSGEAYQLIGTGFAGL